VLEPMPSFIKIPLTESQKKLLQTKELVAMVEPEMKISLSGILSKGEQSHLYLDPVDLKNLIEKISLVTDYEVHNPKLVKQYALLSGYLANFLGEK
jgi:hypothetical protein